MNAKLHDPADAVASAGAKEIRLEPREVLHALWGRRWWVLLVTVVVGLSVAAWTLRQPRIYEAVCTIEYDPNPPQPLGEDIQDVANPGAEFWMNREFYETQNRIIASRAIAERVTRQLSLHHDAAFIGVDPEHRQNWGGVSVEEAAKKLQSRLTVETVKNTRLVQIRVEDPDRERAATLANAIANTYIEKTVEDRMGSTVRALEWLHEQLDTLRQQLDGAEIALHEFRESNNVLSVSLEDRQNLVANEIQRLNEAVTEARTRRIELTARVQHLKRMTESNPEDVFASPLLENEPVRRLRDGIRQKQAEQSRLEVRYGVDHPSMRALTSELEQLQGQLRREVEGLVRAAEADLAEASTVENGLQGALAEAHQAGLQINLREIEFRQLDRDQKNKAELYELVLQRTAETDLTRMFRVTHVRLLDRALPPTKHVSPQEVAIIGTGTLVGLALGMLLAFLLAYTDSRVNTAETVEALGLTILGVLPELQGENAAGAAKRKPPKRSGTSEANPSRDLHVYTHPRSVMAESCRALRTNLAFLSADRSLESIVVTSPMPSEGKTTVAISLAIAFAQTGRKVLVVDSDLRRPRVHRSFGVRPGAGLTSVLVGEHPLDEAIQTTSVPDLHVLPSGPIPPNPAELFHTDALRSLLAVVRKEYDQVIFDSPPLGAVTDAAILAPQLDGVVLVLRAKQTQKKAMLAAMRQLRDVKANLLGGVLNCAAASAGRYGSGYYQSYYYQADPDDDGDDGPIDDGAHGQIAGRA